MFQTTNKPFMSPLRVLFPVYWALLECHIVHKVNRMVGPGSMYLQVIEQFAIENHHDQCKSSISTRPFSRMRPQDSVQLEKK